MTNKLTDEQFDALMKSVLADASMDDETVNDIADSPVVWRQVQRRIAEGKNASSPWPPSRKLWQLFAIGVPAMAAVALVVGIMVFRPWGEPTSVAGVQRNIPTEQVSRPAETGIEPAPSSNVGTQPVVSSLRLAPKQARQAVTKAVFKPAPVAKKGVDTSTVAAGQKKTEIKSDFIALTYARNPDSGQLVRVKVPSSMMVTLGLVATVAKPNELVDAEVVIGDDGLTRAIRFIR